MNKYKVKFLGIPVLKIREDNKIKTVSLFNSIPILKIKKKEEKKNFYYVDKNEINILYISNGGIGDVLISLVFLKKFYEKIQKDCDKKIYFHLLTNQNPKAISLLAKKYDFIKNIFSIKRDFCDYGDINEDNIDEIYSKSHIYMNCVMKRDFNNHKVLYYDHNTIDNNSKLAYYLDKMIDFIHTNPYINNTVNTNLYCLSNDKDIFSILDIDNSLGIDKNEKFEIEIPAEGYKVLDKYNLRNKRIITISRGVNATDNIVKKNNIRLWSMEYYNNLIKLIKQKYKNVVVIQLGVSKDRCEAMKNVDLNLIGETSFEELLCLLSVADLHIDGECGMTHLRHFLSRKPSVVLFGPTSIRVKGYDENINLKSDVCKCEFCEWVKGSDWQYFCLRSQNDESPCMKTLKPEYVFNEVVKSRILEKNGDKNDKQTRIY